MKDYRYILRIEDESREVNPFNVNGLQVLYDAPEDYRFSFVQKLNKKFLFIGEDFHFIYAFEKSSKHCRFAYLDIEKRCSNGWSLFQKARISMRDGEFNIDQCTVLIEVELMNNYACFDDNNEVEINLLGKVSQLYETKLFRGMLEYVQYQSGKQDFFKADEFPEPDPASKGWLLWQYKRVPVPGPDINTFEYYYAREVITVPCNEYFDPLQWVELEACAGGVKIMARPVPFYQKELKGLDGRPPRTGYNYGPNHVGWLFNGAIYTDNVFDNGMMLKDVLNVFSLGFCGKPTRSVFFNIDPDGLFSVVYPQLPLKKTWNVFVYQKSDIKRPNAYSNATNGTTTFKKFINALCKTYNLQFVVTDTEFRIEHVSYFVRNQGIDTTHSQFSKFGKQQRSYSYLKDKMPENEIFEMMEQGYPDFVGMPITYKGACKTTGKTDKILTEVFSTDMSFVMDGGIKDEDGQDNGKISDNGFMLIATEKVGDDYIIMREQGVLSPTPTMNNVLAWAQLHRDYWKWDRPQITGYMNGVYTNFHTAKPVKLGRKVTVPFCCGNTLRLTDYVKTIMGDGIVNKAVYSIHEETLELEVLYRDTIADFVCLGPILFKFNRREGNDFYFDTAFFESSDYTTELEIIHPNGDVEIRGPFTETSGTSIVAIMGTLAAGYYQFRKRTICGTELSPWTDYVNVLYEDPYCTAIIPQTAFTYMSYDAITKRFKFKYDSTLYNGVVELEETRPDGAVFIADRGLLSCIGGICSFNVNANKAGYSAAPSSGLYKFRYRLWCNSIAFGPWSEFKNVTI
jgi:hypothetical protein